MVEPVPLNPGDWERSGGSDANLRLLLEDVQVRLQDGQKHGFYRQVLRVTSERGAAQAGRLEASFDPLYQRLFLHGAWRTRGGERVDVLRPGEVKLLQKEQELEAQLYDGRLTALIFVEDVRVGDVVEFLYSVEGSNPVFEDRYVGGFGFHRAVPIEHYSVRLLWSSPRALRHRTYGVELEPELHDRGAFTEYRWEARGLPTAGYEDGVPGEVDL